MKQQTNAIEKIFLYTYFGWGFILQYIYTVNISIPYRSQVLFIANGFAIFVYTLYIVICFLGERSNIYILGLISSILFLLLGVIYSQHQIGVAYIAIFLLIIGAGTVSFRKILKVFLTFSSLTLFSTIIFNLLNIIPSMTTFSDGRLRDSLGFYYVSFASAIMFFYVCAYLVYRGKNVSYIELIILAAINVFIFFHTRTRNPYMLSMLFIIYVGIYKSIKKRILTRNKVFKIITIYIFPISFLFLIWLLEKAPISIFDWINKAVSYRLSFSVSALNNYGISFLGQRIKMITTDGLGGFGGANYNYIDSFYIQNLIINGWSFILIILIGYTIIVFKSVREHKEILSMALVMVALHAIFDPQLFWAWYSPFGLILGQLFFSKFNDKLLL